MQRSHAVNKYQNSCFQSFACQHFGQVEAIAMFRSPGYFTNRRCAIRECAANCHGRLA
jgi:hypothetical protein